MRNEKVFSVIVYRFRRNEPEFLMERIPQEDMLKFPEIRIDRKVIDEERKHKTVRVSAGERESLTVRLDTVFCHDIWQQAEGEDRKGVVYFAAEAEPEDPDHREREDASLKWSFYSEAVNRVKDEEYRDLLKHAVSYLSIKRGLRNPVREFGFTWYRDHAVDIHSHIIAGVDDGAESVKEGMELLRLDREEGIQWAFATPHYGIENGYAPERHRIEAGYRQLSEEVLLSGSPTKILPGTEWYCSEQIVERIRNKEAFPMGESDWYMVEFLEYGKVTEEADVMLRRLKMMKDNGIKTILAHPERYKAIQQDRDLAKRICDLGVLLQVNAYDLFLNEKDATRNLARWMAKEELISFIGSDMHGLPPKRPPMMREGIRWLFENVEEEYAKEVVRINAERYLGVERLLD